MKGVSQDARKQIEAEKGTGPWLERNIDFDPSRTLDQAGKAKVIELFDWLYQGVSIYKKEQKIFDLEVLIANLLSAGNRPVAISLDRNHWRITRHSKVSYSIIELVKLLNKTGHLNMKTGYRYENASRRTRIWTTDKLLSYCPVYPKQVIYEPVEVVELRDEKGKLKDYKDTAETRRIRKILQNVNSVNKAADIRRSKYSVHATLVAVFNRKFTLYGRLHTKGHRHHYQSFSEDERAEITINGEPVVELDYSGLHPHLLYAKEGIQFFGDPYSIVDDRPEARPFLKQILLCMLNAKDHTAAERAGNFWLYKNHEEREALNKIGITKAGPMIRAFQKAHKPIVHYFCKGKDTGLKIMNKDAKIALDIIQHFAKQNKPILAVHDSFIVQAKYHDELMHIMKSTYKKHTGFRIKVK